MLLRAARTARGALLVAPYGRGGPLACGGARCLSGESNLASQKKALAAMKEELAGMQAQDPEREHASCGSAGVDRLLNPPLAFADHTLRGMGQVVFANSPLSGGIILAALATADPALAGCALLGCASATAAAKAAPMDSAAVADGLRGFNGALVGCGFAVFLAPDLGGGAAGLAAAVAAGGTASAFVADKLGALITNVPQFTLAFNVVTLGTLLAAKPFAAAAAAAEGAAEAVEPAMEAAALAAAPFIGVSQIFVAESLPCGLLVLAALAAGPDRGAGAEAVGYTIIGTTIGAATGGALGVESSAIAAGLCGFNPALTALAVSTFVAPGVRSFALASGGAAATTALTAGLVPIGALLGIPVCTLPFCVAASTALLLAPAVGAKLRQRPS